MGQSPKLLLLGQVFVDVTPGNAGEQIKLRLGGIFHAARATWAMNVPYALVCIAPDYLTKQIEDFAFHHGASVVRQIGTVLGSPNVALIREATEAGPQGYELLLRGHHQCILNLRELSRVAKDKDVTDVVIFPGGFELSPVLKAFAKSKNRGGSRLFKRGSLDQPIRVHAQVRPVVHSVGVGDCFDVVFAVQRHRVSDEAALAYSSSVAAEYAATTFPDDFKQGVDRSLSIPPDVISQLKGVSLPWEDRPQHHIYIAAPDFDYVDRTPIDRLVEALRYHNFSPRLPVREHGQMGVRADRARKRQLCAADLRLLDECSILIAVLIENDPGTLIEIGIAIERGIPVVVYDPYSRADNLMLTELPSLVSPNLDSVISTVFKHISELAPHD